VTTFIEPVLPRMAVLAAPLDRVFGEGLKHTACTGKAC